MKTRIQFLLVSVLLIAITTTLSSFKKQDSVSISEAKINIFFSPRGGCTEKIVKELNGAKKSVYVQAYSFTSAPIAEALVNAKKRKVHVEIILDKSQRTERYSSADFVSHAGISTYIDEKHAIAHNKIMIIDEEKVITGSFNFTKSAEQSNAENLLVIENENIALTYLANWKVHKEHSECYSGK
jgi:phosphatidylserine/phosphatidylglycerophosphate/cardiolipin synthase-like enzyme